MAHGINNRSVFQIGAGALCLAAAWYCGHRSPVGLGQLEPSRSSLPAEDLVWNDSQASPGGGMTSGSDRNSSRPAAAPVASGDCRVAGMPAGSPNGMAAGDPDSARTGPMIIEPDFSALPPPGLVLPGATGALRTLDDPPPALADRRPEIGVSPPPLFDPATKPERVQPDASGAGRFVAVLAPPDSAGSCADAGESGAGSPGVRPVVSRRSGTVLGTGAREFRIHVVRPGETLQSISAQYFGTPDYYLDIYTANQDLLNGPGGVPVGTSLKIPVGGGSSR